MNQNCSETYCERHYEPRLSSASPGGSRSFPFNGLKMAIETGKRLSKISIAKTSVPSLPMSLSGAGRVTVRQREGICHSLQLLVSSNRCLFE